MSTELPAPPDAWIEALSDASLEQAGSAAILQRGRTYAASGAVEVLSEDPWPEPALHAQVAGTDLYETDVWIEDDAVAGACDCPNAEDGWFCKHQVAVALVWRDRLAGHAPAVDEAARKKVQAVAKRARTVKDKRQALHDFLHGLDASALADKLLELADRQRDISRELHQWRKLSDLKDEPAELKPLITEILSPGRDFLSWGDSGGYAMRAEAALPLLQRARARDAGAAVGLCLHALHRAWDALAQADDSNGEIGGLCQAIGEELVLALQAAGPQPAGFGDTYLQLRLDDPFGCFDEAAAEAAMGEAALARYRRALAERWRQAKDAVLALKAEHAAKAAVRKGRAAPDHDRTSESKTRLWTLERLHLAQLEAAGDVDGALAVLREDLSDAQAHHRAVAFLEAHERFREAFAQAEQACKAFPQDWRLEDALLRCYERDGWTDEALALRRRQFDRRPDVEHYHQVLRAAQAAGQDAAALRDALLKALEAREVGAPDTRPQVGRFPIPRQAVPPDARDVSLRAEILASERRWAEACELVQPPAICRIDVMRQIALHLPADRQDAAVALLLRVFERMMQQSGSPYRDELALVGDIARRMDAARRSAWLAQLRAEYKAKRNFVRDLPQR